MVRLLVGWKYDRNKWEQTGGVDDGKWRSQPAHNKAHLNKIQATHTHTQSYNRQTESSVGELKRGLPFRKRKKSNENILIQLGTLWLDPIQSAFDTINIFCHIRRMFIIVVVVGRRRDAAYTRFYSGQIKIMLFILAVGNVDVIFISLMAFRCVYFVTVSTIAVDAVFVIVHAFMPCQNGIGHNCWCALWLSLVNLIEPFIGLFCFYMYLRRLTM